MCENELAKIAVDIAYTVHNILGPGLLESVYESAFAYELEERGLLYSRKRRSRFLIKNRNWIKHSGQI